VTPSGQAQLLGRNRSKNIYFLILEALLKSVVDNLIEWKYKNRKSLLECPASLKISGDSPVKLLNMARAGVNKRRISG
jgi:hypothetical protein